VPIPKEDLAVYLPQFVQGIRDFAAIKGLHYDLIHSHYWLSGLAARDLKAEWNAPIVHMFHTLGMMKQRVARGPGEWEGDYRLKGESEVLRLVDRIVAPTLAELSQLQWLYKADVSKVVVIPPGVDLTHFYPIPPDEAREYIGVPPCEKVVLFVGRIEPLKGIDTLIEAIAILRQQEVTVCLSIIGGDADVSQDELSEEMARLQILREKHGLRDMVTFLGRRGQDTLPYYYSAAEVVVVPSHYESFGMVALEAMACGIPVVASQVGGLAFLVQDGVNGFTVPVDEPQALAECLLKLLQDVPLRRQMGEQAADFALDYSWEKIAARIVKLYQEISLRKDQVPEANGTPH